MATVHIPVLPNEILDLGAPASGQTWIDGTAGGGGHTRLLAEHVGTSGKVVAIDRDPIASGKLSELLAGSDLSGCVEVHNASYHKIPELLEVVQLGPVDGILLDLGLSSDQLADRSRGFSFQGDGELDMRFDRSLGHPVWEWMHRVDEKTLADGIYRYGEERFSRRIARRIVEQRRKQPIKTTEQLRELIYGCIPGARRTTKGSRRHGRVDPATRTFQALRIIANDELAILEKALEVIPACLAEGGRLLVISFHSLEDRIVKYAFREEPRLDIVTKKPVQATDDEIAANGRARSAKLRVAIRNSKV